MIESRDGAPVFAEYHIPSTKIVYGARAPSHICDVFKKSFSSIYEKSEPISDNLINTKRTHWLTHEEPEIKHGMDWVSNQLMDFFQQTMLPSSTLTIEMLNSWIALYNKNSHVSPHNHFMGPNGWSFSLYVDVKKETSITFFDFAEKKRTISVTKGDFIIFPSELNHFSNDMHDGRIIFSGNFRPNVFSEGFFEALKNGDVND